ncbi:MAG: cyclic nucleotide-binding domain-containing protein, partial [Desulfobulbaceae bacterium]|nr:cyclic nucleotide-binding domain-containing protein [Desulfobulbaceae bacterium]
MPDRPSPHAAPPAQVIAFLRQTLPFNTLSSGYLEELARQCLIDFFPKGTLVFEQGVTEVTHFYLIQKGGVRIFLTDEDGEATLKDFRGEGEYFGAVPLLHGTAQANLNVETVEDTFCYLFPKEAFLHLMHTNPRVAQYYLRTMTEKLITSAYTELRQHKVTPRTESALRLVSVPVAEIVKGPPQMVDEATPVQEAAATMSNLHIGSLLVRDRTGAVAGIVTDKDLRTKVVARGLDFSTPVGQIMASPVQSVAGHVVCFDALLTMMSGRIHHLAVTRQEEVIGVVTTHDIMVVQGTSPLYLFREILAQQRIEGLYELSPKVPLIIRSLVEEGAKANNIARMITLLNDHILDRLLAMLVEELGPPPLPFCWLYMG